MGRACGPNWQRGRRMNRRCCPAKLKWATRLQQLNDSAFVLHVANPFLYAATLVAA